MDPEMRPVLWESCPLCSNGYWKSPWSGVGHRGERYKRLVTARPALLITLAGKGSHVFKPFLMLSCGSGSACPQSLRRSYGAKKLLVRRSLASSSNSGTLPTPAFDPNPNSTCPWFAGLPTLYVHQDARRELPPEHRGGRSPRWVAAAEGKGAPGPRAPREGESVRRTL